jgi:hypothetical protein
VGRQQVCKTILRSYFFLGASWNGPVGSLQCKKGGSTATTIFVCGPVVRKRRFATSVSAAIPANTTYARKAAKKNATSVVDDNDGENDGCDDARNIVIN